MEWISATDQQLIQVTKEDCPIEYKYEACRELQIRHLRSDMVIDLVKMWGTGHTKEYISEWLGIPTNRVESLVRKYKLRRVV